MTQVGLCASCAHARTVESRRGSRFWLCALSRVDARFPKYPPLPVLACAGYVVARSEHGVRSEEPGDSTD